MAKLILTIDGPAGSGKSTIAKLLADKIDASFLDTGSMYRAVTLAAINAGVDLTKPAALLKVLTQNTFRFEAQDHLMRVWINETEVTDLIRDPDITRQVRHIASNADMRSNLVAMQREFASRYERIVTEGRDQGTVAFPDAQLKIFLTADPDERAHRRLKELQEKGSAETFDKIKADIIARDESDSNRSVGPLKPADDAVVVDTTKLDIEGVVLEILKILKQHGF